MPTTHSGTSRLLDTNCCFFFVFVFSFLISWCLLIPYANIREKYTCNNHIEFKWSWVQLNVYQNSQSIYISLCFLDCFFIFNSLNNLKNHSRGGLFIVIKDSITFVDKVDISAEMLVFPARLTLPSGLSCILLCTTECLQELVNLSISSLRVDTEDPKSAEDWGHTAPGSSLGLRSPASLWSWGCVLTPAFLCVRM